MKSDGSNTKIYAALSQRIQPNHPPSVLVLYLSIFLSLFSIFQLLDDDKWFPYF